MKTHFATVERANESDNEDYWSDTICGIESENKEDNWTIVSCKKCLKRKEQFENEMKEAMEHNCNDMNGFVEFVKEEISKNDIINRQLFGFKCSSYEGYLNEPHAKCKKCGKEEWEHK